MATHSPRCSSRTSSGCWLLAAKVVARSGLVAWASWPAAPGAATTASCSSSAPSRSDGNAPGRLRLAEIASYGAESLNRFIGHNIAAASTAKTDGWAGYAAAPVETHDPHVIGSMAAHLVLPWIHQVFSNLKGWARGVYHGLRAKHLQSYLDEFVFRFNRRRTRHAAFRSLFGIAVCTKPFTYNMLVRPEAGA